MSLAFGHLAVTLSVQHLGVERQSTLSATWVGRPKVPSRKADVPHKTCGTKRPTPLWRSPGCLLTGGTDGSSKPVSEVPQSKRNPASDCPSCGERVLITAADDWRCPECTTAFCPFCKTSLLDPAASTWSRRGQMMAVGTSRRSRTLHSLTFPRIFTTWSRPRRTGSDVFGKEAAEVVAQAYTDCGALSDREEGEEERELFLLMVERQRLECESSSWAVGHWFTSSHGTDYFSLQREQILAGIKEEVAWLTAGLEQVFAIVRARRDQPTSGHHCPTTTRSTRKAGQCSRPTGGAMDRRSLGKARRHCQRPRIRTRSMWTKMTRTPGPHQHGREIFCTVFATAEQSRGELRFWVGGHATGRCGLRGRECWHEPGHQSLTTGRRRWIDTTSRCQKQRAVTRRPSAHHEAALRSSTSSCAAASGVRQCRRDRGRAGSARPARGQWGRRSLQCPTG